MAAASAPTVLEVIQYWLESGAITIAVCLFLRLVGEPVTKHLGLDIWVAFLLYHAPGGPTSFVLSYLCFSSAAPWNILKASIPPVAIEHDGSTIGHYLLGKLGLLDGIPLEFPREHLWLSQDTRVYMFLLLGALSVVLLAEKRYSWMGYISYLGPPLIALVAFKHCVDPLEREPTVRLRFLDWVGECATNSKESTDYTLDLLAGLAFLLRGMATKSTSSIRGRDLLKQVIACVAGAIYIWRSKKDKSSDLFRALKEFLVLDVEDFDFIDDLTHLLQLAVGISWLWGTFWVIKDRLGLESWKEQGFGSRVSFSLNMLPKESKKSSKRHFKMRTILDESLSDVYPNQHVIETIIENAKADCDEDVQTVDTGDGRGPVPHPFLCLKLKLNLSDWMSVMWSRFTNKSKMETEKEINDEHITTINRMRDQLKNCISAKFGSLFIHEALADYGETKSEKFVYGLTFEKLGTRKLNQKFRCLLIRYNELNECAKKAKAYGKRERSNKDPDYDWTADFEFETTSPTALDYFRDRLRHLAQLSELYESSNGNHGDSSSPDGNMPLGKFALVGDLYLANGVIRYNT